MVFKIERQVRVKEVLTKYKTRPYDQVTFLHME